MSGTLYTDDCLEMMQNFLDTQSIDLIYADPPFFTNRDHAGAAGAYSDKWADVEDYLDWLRPRLREMRRVLKPTGSIYVHCDWHASHYIKVEMDGIFGYDNFRNEIVWSYRRWPSKQAQFQRMHDAILFYSKSGDYTFNVDYEPPSESTQRVWKGQKQKLLKGATKKVTTGEKSNGLPQRDVFTIPIIAGAAAERMGYPTQKPLALLERIIRASSNPGDIVLDPFCGSGTTCVAAEQLGRKYIGIDQSPEAVQVARARLEPTLL